MLKGYPVKDTRAAIGAAGTPYDYLFWGIVSFAALASMALTAIVDSLIRRSRAPSIAKTTNMQKNATNKPSDILTLIPPTHVVRHQYKMSAR